MKLKAAIILQLISAIAGAQTAEDRKLIREASDQTQLFQLKQKNNRAYLETKSKINRYLLNNTGEKRQYSKNGRLYFLHHIDNEVNPIYITTNQLDSFKALLIRFETLDVNLENMHFGIFLKINQKIKSLNNFTV